MAWVDFAVCFLFGYFGVHKFMEKKIGMGVLYLCTVGLFGFGWIYDCVKYFMAAVKGERICEHSTNKSERLPMQRKQLADDEPLPIIMSSNALMTEGEYCHYYSQAIFVKTKNVVVGYTGGSNGVSVRVMKGMSVRVGASKSTPIRSDVQEKYQGMLTITNKRIIFSGVKGSFDKKISSLSTITPLEDGIVFQFGEKQYPLLCNDSNYIYQIIARIINAPEA